VPIGRTSRPKTKRRSTRKPPRSTLITAGRHSGASVASLKNKNALLTRQLNDALAQQKAATKREAATSRELSEALDQQAATSEVLEIIGHSTFDLQRVLEGLLEKAVRLCGADRGFIFTQDGDVYRLAANYGHSAEFVEKIAKRYPITQDRGSASGRAILERRVVHIHDILADPEYRWAKDHHGEEEMHRTILAVPMLREDKTVGVIIIRRTRVEPFTEKQIALVSSFATQAVIAIENARLLNELRESLEQRTATSDVLNVISRSPTDVQPVFDTIARNAAQLCNAQFCHVFRFDGKLIHFAASYGLTPEAVQTIRSGYPLPPGRASVAARSIFSRTVEEIQDIDADPDYQHVHAAKTLGYRSNVAVPMLKDGNPVGAIVMGRPQTGHFPERQIELLQMFADQAVVAIENVRLFEEVQARSRELSESLEQQTATSEVLGVISSSPGELERVFQALLASATRLCQAQFGILYRYDGDVFHADGLYNVAPALDDYLRRDPPRPSPRNTLGRLLETKQPVHVPDMAAEPAYAERVPLRVAAVELAGVRTYLAAPMLKEGELIGAIGIYRQEVRPFTEKQIALVTNFASQAVIAIENTRLLNEVRESLEQQTATADVLKVISRSTFALQTVLDTLVV
jgi:two-component system, NtrC family, sensor kinase